MSLHPAVGSLSSVGAEDVDASNEAAAQMFVRLLTETCPGQARKALQYEGALALQQGFGVFGQVATGIVCQSRSGAGLVRSRDIYSHRYGQRGPWVELMLAGIGGKAYLAAVFEDDVGFSAAPYYFPFATEYSS